MNTYFLVNNGSKIVENAVIWDGSNSWSPPEGYITLEQSTTPAKIWVFDENPFDYVESIQMGAGGIGFTWDGTNLITNEPKPEKPIKPVQQPQPVAQGAQKL